LTIEGEGISSPINCFPSFTNQWGLKTIYLISFLFGMIVERFHHLAIMLWWNFSHPMRLLEPILSFILIILIFSSLIFCLGKKHG
jgi:hypothetical protein